MQTKPIEANSAAPSLQRPRPDAAIWHQDVNSVRLIPIEFENIGLLRDISDDPSARLFATCRDDMREALHDPSILASMMGVNLIDPEFERATQAAFKYLLTGVKHERCTALGLALGALRSFVMHHDRLRLANEGFFRPYPRRIEDIQAEMSERTPRALQELQTELDCALELEAEATGKRREISVS